MLSRLINSIGKALKVFPVGFLGTLLPLVLPFVESALPKPLEAVTTWEAVGLSFLIGGATGLLAGLKRFIVYKASLDIK